MQKIKIEFAKWRKLIVNEIMIRLVEKGAAT